MNYADSEQNENQDQGISRPPIIEGTPSPNRSQQGIFNASPVRGQADDQNDNVDDSFSGIEQRNNENMEFNHQRIKDDLDSSRDSEQINTILQQRLHDENLNEEDLNRLPNIELIDKFQKLRNILENNAIEAHTRNKILDQLSQIDKRFQSIEERELNKNFKGAYECYNLILRRYYEKQLRYKDGELRKLQNEIEDLEAERNQLNNRLRDEEKVIETLKDEHIKKTQDFGRSI